MTTRHPFAYNTVMLLTAQRRQQQHCGHKIVGGISTQRRFCSSNNNTKTHKKTSYARQGGRGIAALLGLGAAASLYIDYEWFTFQRANTTTNEAVMGRTDGLAGHTYNAYNRDVSKLGEKVVEYPSLKAYTDAKATKEAVAHPETHSHTMVTIHDDDPIVDVCIVGGGFSGLHTALALVEKDQHQQKHHNKHHRSHNKTSIVLLEANRIGSGASGVCGGMAIVGYETELEMLVPLVGKEKARVIYQQSVKGYERLKDVIRRFGIKCGMVEEGLLEMMLANRFAVKTPASQNNAPGTAAADGTTSPPPIIIDQRLVEEEMVEATHECQHDEEAYGQQAYVMTKEAVAKEKGLSSDRFAYGCYNPRTFSVNPLALVLGLARACVSSGQVRIHERSEVVSVERETSRFPLDALLAKKKELLEKRMSKKAGVVGDVATTTSTATSSLFGLLASLKQSVTTSTTNTTGNDDDNAAAVALQRLIADIDREIIRLAATYEKYGAGDWVITTADGGRLKAKEVLIATNYVPWKLRPKLSMCTSPCTTTIMLTKPFPKELLDEVFSYKGCVIDERFGLVYFRRTDGDRIVFGGLASGKPFASNMAKAGEQLQKEFILTFPTLAPHLAMEEHWEGRIEHRDTLFPLVGRDNVDGLWYSVGFSGHGVVPTCTAGEIVAGAIGSVPHPADVLADATIASPVALASAAGTTAVARQRLLEPTDTRYQLWNEVSLFPDYANSGRKVLSKRPVGWMPPSTGDDEDSSSLFPKTVAEVASLDEATKKQFLVANASIDNKVPLVSRYMPPVLPPAGFPCTSVLPYIFIDYILPLWEWSQGSI